MKKFEYLVRFTTPAFLGNAEQSGQWRTPPFKAQLRQWWRMAYAADHGFEVDVPAMRRDEGVLFGMAADEGNSSKSRLRMRLDRWDEGRLKSWDGLEQPKVHHPETERTQYKVGPHAYLGYGPLDGRGNTTLKSGAAIQASESAYLRLALTADPSDSGLTARESPRVATALALMNRYGTLGGRSRNGWGSFTLTPLASAEGAGERKTPPQAGALPLRPWRECLDRDWPHAIGADEQGPLAWQTEPFDDWKATMRRLAEIWTCRGLVDTSDRATMPWRGDP